MRYTYYSCLLSIFQRVKPRKKLMAIISFGNEEHVKIFTMGYEECYGADLFALK